MRIVILILRIKLQLILVLRLIKWILPEKRLIFDQNVLVISGGLALNHLALVTDLSDRLASLGLSLVS